MSSPVRLSRRPSVKFVRPTQTIEISGNLSTPFCTVATHWHPREILRRSSEGNPSVGEIGVNEGGIAFYTDFGPFEGYVTETVQDMI